LGSKNEAGDTALHLAARHGHHEAVEALVMSGSEEALGAIVEHCSEDASCAGPSSQNVKGSSNHTFFSLF
jgi:ankyrin repeat protein